MASKKRKRAPPPAVAAAALEGETTAAAGGADASSSSSAGKKLLVKNLAFESSNKELRQLFGSFGQLKSVRMPRKFDGGHRGFAFVEYTSHKDARAAMDELASTHFYGRHLVVDWAKEAGGVEDSRLQSQKDAVSIRARRADKDAADFFASSAVGGGGGGGGGEGDDGMEDNE
jgi:multiple RNA-binding domain-containing protein 1